MITALDTSVLLDVFGADPRFGPASKAALEKAISEGSIMACEVVWAELGAAFASSALLQEGMRRIDAAFSPLTQHAALRASNAWRDYRLRGGRRERVAADFLIGAHAIDAADRLLTRDRGFYRKYFATLNVLEPAREA